MTTDTITKDSVITIDYGKSLEVMIAAGKYDWVNPNITPKNFPITATGIVQFEPKIFHFDRHISSEDAVEAIKADDRGNPWEPAKIEHLLAYGATYPEDQRQYPIVGLGSVAEVGGRRFVPYLSRRGTGRGLDLDWWDDGWRGNCRFLAVRKLSSAA
jgi:hypothetical protein